MTRHDQILERMRGANPLPDVDGIGDAELVALSLLLEQRRPSLTEQSERLSDTRKPAPERPRRWLRPAVVFVAVLVLVVAAIGIVAVLPEPGDDVVDEPTTTVTNEPTTATTQSPVVTTVAVPTATDLTWSRVPYDESVFGGEVTDVGASNASMFDVTFGHGIWVAVGWGSGALGPDNAFVDRAAVWYSQDAVTWTRAAGHPDLEFGDFPWDDGGPHMRAVAATGSGFVAVGYDADFADGSDRGQMAAAWTSPDGRAWTRVPYNEAVFGGFDYPAFMNDVMAIDDRVTAVGRLGDAAAVWQSNDGGLTWSLVPHDPAVFGRRDTPDEAHDGLGDGAQTMTSIVVTPDGFVAAGADGGSPDEPQPDDLDAVVWRSANGIAWERLPDAEGTLGGEGDQEISTIVALPDRYVAVGQERFSGPEDPQSRAAAWYSTDLTSWNRVRHDPAVFGDNDEATLIMRAAVGPTGIIAVGQAADDPTRAVLWASPNGTAWTRIDTPVFGNRTWLRSVVTAENGYVLVGGEKVTDDWSTAHAAVWIASLPTD